MRHFLIDGYNLLFALPTMPPGSWLEKRLALMVWLSQMRPQGRNACTVVFDNRQGWGNQEHRHEMTIIYTSGETADDWLIRNVRESKNPRILTVVSNDKGIQKMIRGTGAQWISATEFIGAIKSPRGPNPAEDVPAQEKETINDELRRRWLVD